MPYQPLHLDFNAFLSKDLVVLGGAMVAGVVVLGVLIDLVRWRSAILRANGSEGRAILSSSDKARVFADTLAMDMLYQRPIAECSRTSWFTHFAIFWGFIGLALATILDEVTNPKAAPLELDHPVRIIGNVGGVLMMLGGSIALARRFLVPTVRRSTTFGDMLFLGMLYGTAITGFIVQYFSDIHLESPAFASYWAHIIFVAVLLATAPFTKFAHALGRSVLFLILRLELAKQKKQIPASQRLKT